jgi:hypothetical protein
MLMSSSSSCRVPLACERSKIFQLTQGGSLPYRLEPLRSRPAPKNVSPVQRIVLLSIEYFRKLLCYFLLSSLLLPSFNLYLNFEALKKILYSRSVEKERSQAVILLTSGDSLNRRATLIRSSRSSRAHSEYSFSIEMIDSIMIEAKSGYSAAGG